MQRRASSSVFQRERDAPHRRRLFLPVFTPFVHICARDCRHSRRVLRARQRKPPATMAAAARQSVCLQPYRGKPLPRAASFAVPRELGARCAAGRALRKSAVARPPRRLPAALAARACPAAVSHSSRGHNWGTRIAWERLPRRPPPRQGLAAVAAADGVADTLGAFPFELALLLAFAAGAATAAAVMTRESVLGLPLSPLPNAKRLSPAAAPDRILTGSGVVVLQHLLKYFYPGVCAVRPRMRPAPRSPRRLVTAPP